MTYNLPSLNAMRAFEAAARFMSFKEAAHELHVTPGAISQQIKALEEQLRTPLFRRHNRTISLTEAGQMLFPVARSAFQQVSDTVDKMQARDTTGPLTVSVLPSFAAKWLVPRLGRFRQQEPDIDVRISSTPALVDFSRENVDCAIRHGLGDYPGLRSDKLLHAELFPVCSPRLVEQGSHPLREPADLRYHTLLHSYRAFEWQCWLEAQGVNGIDATRGPHFSDDALVLEAALDGQGVAISRSHLFAEDLRAGQLTRPFGDLGTPDRFSYYLVCPEESQDNPKIAAFREWVLDEARTTSARSL